MPMRASDNSFSTFCSILLDRARREYYLRLCPSRPLYRALLVAGEIPTGDVLCRPLGLLQPSSKSRSDG